MERSEPVVRRPGRPTRLTEVVADRLVELVAAGATAAEAAEAVGIDARTIRGWRQRAYSRAPEDAAHVRLEKRLQGAREVAVRIR